MFCGHCGTKMKEMDSFCPECGKRQLQENQGAYTTPPSDTNQGVYIPAESELKSEEPSPQEPSVTAEADKKTFLAVGAIATICAAFIILVIIGLFLVFRTSYVEIPNLADLTEEAAIELIEEVRLTVGEITEEYNRRIEVGLVISQSPRAGREVERGSVIDLVISLGMESVEVPDVTDLELDEATNLIRDLRLALGDVDEEFSETVDEGVVIAQSIGAGVRVEEGESIDLIVSLGPEPDPEPIEYITIGGEEFSVTASSLNLENKNLTDADIEPLQHMENLRWLNLRSNQIRDLTPLSHLTELWGLFLDDNQISDLTPLSNINNLERLYLSNNQIEDLTSLSRMSILTDLCLYNNRISDLTPLANLTELEMLFLQNNQISDLAPLSGLTNLKWLYFDGNQISDLTPLSDLTDLRWLFLESNQISDLTTLSGLTNLTRLCLVRNPISDVSPLSGMTNLMELCLLDEQIDEALFPTNLNNLHSAILAYREFLSQEHSMAFSLWDNDYVVEWNIEDVMQVKLVDFANDNVPELVVVIRPLSWDESGHWSQVWAGGMIYVFGYTGEVELLYEGLEHGEGGVWGVYELAFHESGRTYFVVVNGSSQEIEREYLTLRDGELRSVMTRVESGWAIDEEDRLFYVNGSSVSEAEYNDSLMNYGIIEVREVRGETRAFRGIPRHMYVTFNVDSLFLLQWLNF